MAGYQVMPRLSPERYAALEADIIANGVQDPIKVSEAGVIVDGHHRDEIARKHDLHCPRVVVKGDDAYLRDRAYTWNGARRDLTAEERRAVAEKSLRSDPILRDSDHARRTGMDRKTVKRIRESLGIPTPDDVIREYAEAHPEKNDHQVSQDLGVSPHTVKSVRSDLQKREFPENAKPAPEREHASMAGPNEETPEWEEVGNIPQSRLKNLTPAPGFNPGDLEALNTPVEVDEELEPARQHPAMPKPEYTPEQLASKRQREANERAARYIENFAIAYATVYEVLQDENLNDILQLVTPNIRDWFTDAEKEMTWPTPM